MPDEATLAESHDGRRDEDAPAVRGPVGTTPLETTAGARDDRQDHDAQRLWHLGVGALERREGRARSRRRSRRTRSSSAGSARRHVARLGRRFHLGRQRQPKIPAGGLGKFSAIELRKVVDGQGGAGRAVITELEEGVTGTRLPQGPRDDVPVDLHDVHAAAAGPRPLQRHDEPDQNHARQPDQPARLPVHRHARRGALTEPFPHAADYARAHRPDEPREVAGLLQGPVRRRERLHVRLRRQLRRRDHAAAGRTVPGQPAVTAPERDVEERRHQPAQRGDREARRERDRAEEPREHQLYGHVSVRPDTARRDPGDGDGAQNPASARSFARISAGRTASARRRATRSSPIPNTGSPSNSAAARTGPRRW